MYIFFFLMSWCNSFWLFWARVLCSSVCSGIHYVTCSPGWPWTRQSSCLHPECWDYKCVLLQLAEAAQVFWGSIVSTCLSAYLFLVIWLELSSLHVLHILGKYHWAKSLPHFEKKLFWDLIPRCSCLEWSFSSTPVPRARHLGGEGIRK